MSNRRNPRRGGPGRRHEKSRKPKKASSAFETVLHQQAPAQRARKAKDAADRRWWKARRAKTLKSLRSMPPYWGKGNKGTKRRRQRRTARAHNEWLRDNHGLKGVTYACRICGQHGHGEGACPQRKRAE